MSIACASCRRLVAADAPCPHCGHVPASAAGPTPEHPPEGAPVPGPPAPDDRGGPNVRDAPDATLVLPLVPDATSEFGLPHAGGSVPPRQPDATPSALSVAPPSIPPISAPEHARRHRGIAVLAGAAGLALVGLVAVAGLRSGAGEDATSTSAAGGSPGFPDVAPVSRSDVRATASTTQRADGGISYAAANTLDGRPETAWNSDGQGAGASLTYTFSGPVDLRTITIRNGYQKTLTRSDGSPVDLYLLNERVKTVTVITDAGSATWTLRDDRAPQTFGHAFGTTRTVRLEVLSVYPSQKYRDLAVSDVGFGVAES